MQPTEAERTAERIAQSVAAWIWPSDSKKIGQHLHGENDEARGMYYFDRKRMVQDIADVVKRILEQEG